MKKFYLVLTLLLSTIVVQAQTVERGDFLFNAGVGIGNSKSVKPNFVPVAASIMYVVKDNLFDSRSALSIGPYVNYYGAKHSINNVDHNMSNFVFGLRGTSHYNAFGKFDLYTGLFAGYEKAYYSNKIDDKQSKGIDENNGEFVVAAYVGARYFFSKHFAAFAELGYGVSTAELGLTISL